MSGGAGVTQFQKCRCGGLINEGWDACKFCGAGFDEGDEASDSADADSGRANSSSESGSQKLTIAIVAGVVVLVVGLVGSFVFSSGSSSADSSASGQDIQDEPTRLLRSYQDFCTGDRGGISEASPFDETGTNRAVFINGGAAVDSKAPNSRFEDEAGGYASLIVCIDVAGDIVDGDLCEGYDDGAVFLPKMAPMRLIAFEAKTGTVVTETAAPPETGCPDTVAVEPDSGGVAIGQPMPDSSVYDPFVTILTNPAA